MIAEQDFILRIRRMHRLAMPGVAINFVRKLVDYGQSESEADTTADQLRIAAQKIGGEVLAMSNGDLFVVLPTGDQKQALEFRTLAGEILFHPMQPKEREEVMVSYRLPNEYTVLRERANAYVELARAVEVMGPMRQAEEALAANDVRGPLTAWSLSQVEQLLGTIDIKRYVHTQPVYQQVARGVWEKKYIDFYVSISELQRERFPRLVLSTPERLFLDLCTTLDRKFFQELSYQADSWKDKRISINMAAETVLSSIFAQFCHVLPKEKRPNVSFDIHRSDLFLNFTTTRNAISILKSEGFGVGIDGITPSTLPFINFSLLDVDYYKIMVAREKLAELKEEPAMQALKKLDRAKVIFYQCDSEEALRFGQELGITQYQGWLIDDVANAVLQ
jgi:EAL domain-containing protein (putative c-di-GMP-specific phosphodiesterase class I)